MICSFKICLKIRIHNILSKYIAQPYSPSLRGSSEKFLNFLYCWSDLTEICTQYVKLKIKHFLFMNIFPFRA